MIFNELYGAYYNVMAKLISEAIENNLDYRRLIEIVNENAYRESLIGVASAIDEGRWEILKKEEDGLFNTSIINPPKLPLTITQKRWLKAVSMDPRFRLFGIEIPEFDDVEPLFNSEDIFAFDKYSDGDDYSDAGYVKRFRLILDAIKSQRPVYIVFNSRVGRERRICGVPLGLEYSEKDDKFRVYLNTNHDDPTFVNLGRVTVADYMKGDRTFENREYSLSGDSEVVLELLDERKSLERALLHFAHFEKEATRLDANKYQIKIKYSSSDETEVLIRILSFGARIKVVAPQDFKERITERINWQRDLLLKKL